MVVNLIEWDLDGHPDDTIGSAGVGRWVGSHRLAVAAVVVLIALGLVGGGTLRATLAPAAAAAGPPPATRLSLLDVELQNAAVAVLRLQVTDPGPAGIGLRWLTLTGLNTTLTIVDRNAERPSYLTTSTPNGNDVEQVTVPLDDQVGPGQTLLIDLSLQPDCRQDLGGPLSATLGLAGGLQVAVPLDGGLGEGGSLCQQVGAALPVGWRAPITVQPDGIQLLGDDDLRLILPGLGAGSRITGIWANDDLLQTREVIGTSGPDTRVVQLIHPSGCLLAAPGDRVPTGVRLLVIQPGVGLVFRYAAIGPLLARWFNRGC